MYPHFTCITLNFKMKKYDRKKIIPDEKNKEKRENTLLPKEKEG